MATPAPRIERLVVKLGSAVIAPEGKLNPDALARLAGDVAGVIRDGTGVVVVSSGAVASGYRHLGLKTPPKAMAEKQAAAAVGQTRLMSAWAEAFVPHGLAVAQVLLTADDVESRTRFLNARRTLRTLLARGVVPIVNENDSVAFDEIRVGDNDRLSALTAGLIDAQLLLILSTVHGVYAKGSKDRVIPFLNGPQDAEPHLRSERSSVGTGGMQSKIAAAATAGAWGIPSVIAGGTVEGVVRRVLAGEAVGTRMAAARNSRPWRKRWLESSAKPKGALRVDAGAAKALLERGSSLLPSGVLSVSGTFTRGQAVDIHGPDGGAIARGVSLYSAEEIGLIKGRRSASIAGVLGYFYADEIVHRDDLVLL